MSIVDVRSVWPEWTIEEKPLGRGSYGVVYKAVRKDHEVESSAAIKVISIPQDESEIDSLIAEGMSKDLTRTYLEGVVNDFVSEIQLMESFKGTQNIVSVEDYKVIERTDEVGWDIFIRMELLTPFSSFISDKTLSEDEVIKIGVDICNALELCAERNVIHRDIKPQNIFINQFGHYKLGDFGIARKLESVTGGLSQKGSPNYMAPEVARGTQYDATVDLYSLGIVLYQLLNKNRLPFLDTERQLVNPNERAEALNRRLSGEPLPAPCDASHEMASIILCACNPDPKKRFGSAKAMRIALNESTKARGSSDSIGTREEDLNKTMSVRHAAPAQDLNQTVSSFNNPQNQQQNQRVVETFGEKKKSKTPIIIAIAVAVVLLIGGGVFSAMRFLGSDEDTKIADSSTEETTVVESNTDGTAATEEKSSETDAELQKKEQTLETAKNYADSGEYVLAIALLKKEMQTSGEDEDYSKALNTYIDEYKTVVITDADKLADDGNYTDAIKKIDEAISVIGNDQELENKAESYENRYAVEIVADIDVLIVDGKYDDASKKMTTAIKQFPNNTTLQKEKEKIEKSMPTMIANMEIVENDGAAIKSGVEDSLGNKYAKALVLSRYVQTPYAKYYLGGQYKQFRCQFACDDGSDKSDYRLEIYGDNDGLPIYSLDYTRALPVTPIEIDVTGVEFLTFQISAGKGQRAGIINDGMLYVDTSNTSNSENSKKPSQGNATDTNLINMKMIEGDGAAIKSGAEDSLGNKYAKALVLSRYGQTPYAKYYLGGQYKHFKCQFACDDGSDKSDYRLEIYGDNDGVPIYSLDYTRALPVTPIEIDVTGVEFLTFQISAGKGQRAGIINDGMLYVDPSNASKSENGEKTSQSNTTDTNLINMKIVEGDGAAIKSGAEDSLGNKYAKALVLSRYGQTPYAQYYLGGQYKQFKCQFVCDDGSDKSDYRLEIYGDNDGVPIYSLDYTRALPVTPIEIDVTGVEFLTFQISAGKGQRAGIINDGMLYVDPSNASKSENGEKTSQSNTTDTNLINMKIVEGDGAAIKSGAEDSLGNKYAKALVLSRYGQTPYAQYYLGGQYKQFKCQFVCDDGSDKSDYRLEIYGDNDGVPIYSLDYTRALPVTPIEIDVTGVEFLTFQISAGKGQRAGIINDGMLYVK